MATKQAVKAILLMYSGLVVVFGVTLFLLEWQFQGDSAGLVVSVKDFGEAEEVVVNQPLYVSVLDGLPIEKLESQVLAVVIENFPESRPQQKGLSRASVVHEVLAEGGITRFLALFSYQNLEKVGPVRSARPYLVNFAADFNAAFLHAGGSNWGIEEIAKYNRVLMRDVDGLYWEEMGKYFRRDANYEAPHDLFAYLDEVRVLVKDQLDWEPELPESFFTFDRTIGVTEPVVKTVVQADSEGVLADEVVDKLADQPEWAKSVIFDFSYPGYKAEYYYNPVTERYVRYQDAEKHLDGDQEITPANVLVRFTDYYAYDEEGRLDMTVTGEGEAWLFTKGLVFKGEWQKEEGERTQFLDAKGEPFKLTPGQTWIEVISGPGRVEYQ